MAIKIKLGSAAMGDVSEADFDAWASYVRSHIDDATGIDVSEIDQFSFGTSDDDQIRGADEDQRATLRTWLSVDGWEAFCSDATAWPKAERAA